MYETTNQMKCLGFILSILFFRLHIGLEWHDHV